MARWTIRVGLIVLVFVVAFGCFAYTERIPYERTYTIKGKMYQPAGIAQEPEKLVLILQDSNGELKRADVTLKDYIKPVGSKYTLKEYRWSWKFLHIN